MMTADTVNQLSRKWWTFLLRGIVAIALAAFAFGAPASVATALVYVFAAYFIFSGVATLFTGFSFTGAGHWWVFVLMGIVQAALGVIMLIQPGAGPLALAYLFALWMLTSGMMELSAAFALRHFVANEFWLLLLGVISLAFGFYAVLIPALGIFALVYTIGFYAVFAGISMIALSFRLKRVGTKHAAAS